MAFVSYYKNIKKLFNPDVSPITRVPMPTKLRIDRWTFNFMELLNDQRGRKEFLQFLEKEFSGKHICWICCVSPASHTIRL